MKKKIVSILLVVIAAFACAFGMTACTDDEEGNVSELNGTYYVYFQRPDGDGKYSLFLRYILEDGNVDVQTMMDGSWESQMECTYSVKNGNLVIKANGASSTMERVSEGCYKTETKYGELNSVTYLCVGTKLPPIDRELIDARKIPDELLPDVLK